MISAVQGEQVPHPGAVSEPKEMRYMVSVCSEGKGRKREREREEGIAMTYMQFCNFASFFSHQFFLMFFLFQL